MVSRNLKNDSLLIDIYRRYPNIFSDEVMRRYYAYISSDFCTKRRDGLIKDYKTLHTEKIKKMIDNNEDIIAESYKIDTTNTVGNYYNILYETLINNFDKTFIKEFIKKNKFKEFSYILVRTENCTQKYMNIFKTIEFNDSELIYNILWAMYHYYQKNYISYRNYNTEYDDFYNELCKFLIQKKLLTNNIKFQMYLLKVPDFMFHRITFVGPDPDYIHVNIDPSCTDDTIIT
jgi:hypothetical protein